MYYDETPETYKVSVLGTEYKVYVDVPQEKDELLQGCCGYCDKSAKRIAVVAEPKDSELANWTYYSKESLRHELIHAFMSESGIDGNCLWDIAGEEHPEHMVAWLAIQFPKILKVFQEVNAL